MAQQPVSVSQFLKPNPKNVIIWVIVILAIIVLWRVFKSVLNFLGIKADSNNYNPNNLPNNGSGIPKNWSPNALAAELWAAMDGIFNSTSTRNLAFAKLNALTNDQIVAVNDVYNNLYGKSDGMTLIQKIEGEWMPFSEEKTVALSKLRSLVRS